MLVCCPHCPWRQKSRVCFRPVSGDTVHLLLMPCADPPSDPKDDATGAGGRAGASSSCSPSPCGAGKGDPQGEEKTGSSGVQYCKTAERSCGLGRSCSSVTRLVTIPVDEEMLAREKGEV